MTIFVVNGPNLNLLGEREPAIYGSGTLADLEALLRARAQERGAELRFFQSNHEGAIIDALHDARRWAAAILINPGAYTHYSYAIRDALAAIAVPAVEVHLSDVAAREPFRRISVVRDVCIAAFAGDGFGSYVQALDHVLARLGAPDA